MNPPFRLGAVILAAGASTRMGSPKMLLPWAGTTVIGHIIQLWSEQLQAAEIAVVCAPPPSAVMNELDRLNFSTGQRIINPQPDRGMLSSIQCAAAWPGWQNDLTHLALILGDQPHLRRHALQILLESVRQNPSAVHQPSRNDRPKHPIIFPAEEWRSLANPKCETLREYFEKNGGRKSPLQLVLVKVDDPGLDLDLDYPADYQAALELGGH